MQCFYKHVNQILRMVHHRDGRFQTLSSPMPAIRQLSICKCIYCVKMGFCIDVADGEMATLIELQKLINNVKIVFLKFTLNEK